MTLSTIETGADTAPCVAAPTRGKSVDVWAAFYDQVNSYDEPARPSVDDVKATARRVAETLATPLSQLQYDDDGTPGLIEGRTFRIAISPGVIACRSTDLNGREHTIARGRYGSADDEYSELSARAKSLDMLNAFRVDLETGEMSDEMPDLDGPSRKEIMNWSAKSRANMVKTLASLDYSTWDKETGSLAMVTLTLPGDWEAVAPDGKTFKAHVERFRRRWVRAVGPWVCLWKLEFQQRGAPHWHGLMRVPAMVGGETFETWLARTWAVVVGASDVVDRADGSSEHSRHLAAGTGVDFSGKDFSDPRRISMYFLGHSAKTTDGKEYQHIVPELWQAPGKGPGRFWGFCGLDKALVEVDLTQRDYDRLRRELRKLARARAWETAVKRSRGRSIREGQPFQPVHTIRAPRLRRSQLGGGGGQNGGWVLLNDALKVASQLTSHLRQ